MKIADVVAFSRVVIIELEKFLIGLFLLSFRISQFLAYWLALMNNECRSSKRKLYFLGFKNWALNQAHLFGWPKRIGLGLAWNSRKTQITSY